MGGVRGMAGQGQLPLCALPPSCPHMKFKNCGVPPAEGGARSMRLHVASKFVTPGINTNLRRTKCPDYLTNNQLTSNPPDLNPLVIPRLWQYWRLLQSRRRSSNFRKRCRWSGIACLVDRLTKLWRSVESDQRLVLKLKVNIAGDYRILTFCYCRLNNVIYCVFAATFLTALKWLRRWQHCNTDNSKTVYDNEMLFILICTYVMTT